MREDIAAVEFAESLGYTVERGRDKALLVDGKLPEYIDGGGTKRLHCSGDPYSFTIGSTTIWSAKWGWMAADKEGLVFKNHRRYTMETLKEVLTIEAAKGVKNS